MKNIFTLIVLAFVSLSLSAQEVKHPLERIVKEKNEIIPPAPSENLVWVKSNWKWENGRYVWHNGYYQEPLEGNTWVDGDWERNTKTGWWVFNEGYWRKKNNGIDFKSKSETVASLIE